MNNKVIVMSEFNRILEQRLAQRNVEQAKRNLYETVGQAQRNLYEAQAYYYRLLQGQDAQNMMASYGIGEAPSYSDVQNYQMRYGGCKPKAALGNILRKRKDEQKSVPSNEEPTENDSNTVKKTTFNTKAPFYFTPTPYNTRKWQGRDMEAIKNAYTQVYGNYQDQEAWAKGLALAQAGIRDPEVDALLPRRVRNRSVGYMLMNSNPNYFSKPADATDAAEVTNTTEGTDTAEGNNATQEQEATETTEQTSTNTNPVNVEETPAPGTATGAGNGSGTATSGKGNGAGTVTRGAGAGAGNQVKVQSNHNITQQEARRIDEDAAKKQGTSVEMSNAGYKPVSFEQYANHQQRVYSMAGVTSPYNPKNRYAMAVDENGRKAKLYTPYYEMSKYYGKSYKDIDRAVYQAKHNQNSDLYDPDNVDQVLAYAKKHPNEYVYGNFIGRNKGYFKYDADPAYNSSNHLKWYGYTLPQHAYGGNPEGNKPWVPYYIPEQRDYSSLIPLGYGYEPENINRWEEHPMGYWRKLPKHQPPAYIENGEWQKGAPIYTGYAYGGDPYQRLPYNPNDTYGGDPYQRLPYNPNDTTGFRTERLPLKKGQNIKDYNNPFQPL